MKAIRIEKKTKTSTSRKGKFSKKDVLKSIYLINDSILVTS
jgi:hypothetical protein